MVEAACARGERCLSFVFEESGEQICRNARSVGLDLTRHVDSGLLRFEAARPTLYGLEMHLARMHRDIEQFRPHLVVIDPISALRGPEVELQATLLRMVDMLKSRGITAVFTSLRTDGAFGQAGDLGLSSLMDVWIKLQDIEANGERSRTLYVIKARGMSHSNQVREFQMAATRAEARRRLHRAGRRAHRDRTHRPGGTGGSRCAPPSARERTTQAGGGAAASVDRAPDRRAAGEPGDGRGGRDPAPR